MTQDVREAVRKRVKARNKLYRGLVTYFIFCAFFIALDVIPDGSLDWAYWPILGWGIGMASHAAKVFFGEGNLDREEQQIERELEKLERRKQQRAQQRLVERVDRGELDLDTLRRQRAAQAALPPDESEYV